MLTPLLSLAVSTTFGSVLAPITARMMQDVRMEQAIAVPVDPQAAPPASPSSSSTSPVATSAPATFQGGQGQAMSVDATPISIEVRETSAETILQQLMTQGVNLAVDPATFPKDKKLTLLLTNVPASQAMMAIGQALGGQFLPVGTVFVWSGTPAPAMGFGEGGAMSRGFGDGWGGQRDMPAQLGSVVAAEMVTPIARSFAIAGTADLKFSAAQKAIAKSRGYLKWSDLSQTQKLTLSRIPVPFELKVQGVTIKR